MEKMTKLMENQSLMTSTDPTLAHIQLISEQLDALYQAMKAERRAIDQWEADQPYSILGVIELFSTDIQGYAAQILAGGAIAHAADYLSHLRQLNVFRVDYFATWYFAHLDTYPQIKQYVEQLDHLRLLLIEYGALSPAVAA